MFMLTLLVPFIFALVLLSALTKGIIVGASGLRSLVAVIQRLNARRDARVREQARAKSEQTEKLRRF